MPRIPETYTNSTELLNKHLKHKDRIIFKINNEEFRYLCEVYQDILFLCSENNSNSIIYDKLLLINPVKFTEKHIGYIHENSSDYNIPIIRTDDYDGLTKLTIALFKESEKILINI